MSTAVLLGDAGRDTTVTEAAAALPRPGVEGLPLHIGWAKRNQTQGRPDF
eukprot:gene1939-3600_t